MAFQLKYWNAPPDHERHNPLSSQFADMPSDTFATMDEARSAAEAFVNKYTSKGGDSAGGYNQEMDLFWIRDEVGPDLWRFTMFGVMTVTAAALAPGPAS